MNRRDLLQAGAAAVVGAAASLPAPAVAQRAGARTLRVIPASGLASLDPIWTTANPSRIHGFMIYDTLYGQDAQFRAQPQMAEGHEVSADGREWRIRLRDGLRFHDGEPVRAQDCVPSIARWGRRDAMGQTLVSRVDRMEAANDRTVLIRLRRPFPMLLDALARVGSNAPFMMPERVAKTDAFQQITETVGSGPFRFRRDEWVSGAFAAWERNPDYVPRPEPAEWTAGGKRALVDRVEWRVVPDPATAAAALQAGEVDWWDNPIADLLPVLRRNRSVVLEQVNTLGEIGTLRFNHTQPPFNNPEIRRAVASAMDQRSYMQAAVGTDQARWRAGVGIFTPETPLANEEGMDILNRPRDLAASRRALERAGYKGERVVLMGPTDLPIVFAQAQVTAQLFRDLGMDLDFVATDFGTIIQRRTSKAPPQGGGWSAFHTFWLAFDHLNPAADVILRGNGENAWFGWPSSPDVEQLREAWFDEPDRDTQKTIAGSLQAAALRDLPYVPTGQWFVPTAYRSNLRGILRGPGLQHWNVEKAA